MVEQCEALQQHAESKALSTAEQTQTAVGQDMSHVAHATGVSLDQVGVGTVQTEFAVARATVQTDILPGIAPVGCPCPDLAVQTEDDHAKEKATGVGIDASCQGQAQNRDQVAERKEKHMGPGPKSHCRGTSSTK